ncbi:hypothetical protein HJG60_010344 [Phyllostomus discolor]|uniref:Uncharacterized protein n=1 Tax=Phyllostomus discolor TaxID=89673 RepID=A0A834EMW1_9CHIR|nr:hypothetical protein HJG60_010344 [Phyllostomus discolor]
MGLLPPGQPASLQSKGSMTERREKARETGSTPFCNLDSEAISHHFCHIVLIRSKSPGQPTLDWRGDLHKDINARRQGSLGTSSEAACHGRKALVLLSSLPPGQRIQKGIHYTCSSMPTNWVNEFSEGGNSGERL